MGWEATKSLKEMIYSSWQWEQKLRAENKE